MAAAIAAALLSPLPGYCELPSPSVRMVDARGNGHKEEAPNQIGPRVARSTLALNYPDEFPAAWWNWIFVVLFAFFGLGQLVVLLYQSHVVGRTANAAKRAVDLTERTVAEFESPFLFPVLVSTSILDELQEFENHVHPTAPVNVRVSFTIKNFGRTPALLQRATAVFFAGELDEAHNDPLSGRLSELMLEPQGNLITPIEREIVQPIDQSIFDALKNISKRIYLRGRITFLDVLGNRYEQTFCFTWDMETKAFIPWGPHRNRRKRLSSGRRRLA
jgi:hypothetical protein